MILGLIIALSVGMVAAVIGGLVLFSRSIGQPQPIPTRNGIGLVATPGAQHQPTATALAQAESTILLADNFDDPRQSHMVVEQSDAADYRFEAGTYAISTKKPSYIAWSEIDGSYSDSVIDVDTIFKSGPKESSAGIIFRYQDEDNFYFFNISGDGSYSLDLYKDNQHQTLIDWTITPQIKGRGQTNHLRIMAIGDRFQISINGRLIDEVSDSTFSKGKIALSVNTFSKGDATFLFDNLAIRGTP